MRAAPNHPSSRPTRQLQQPPPKKINQHESNESEESYDSEESDDIDINTAYQQHILKKKPEEAKQINRRNTDQ